MKGTRLVAVVLLLVAANLHTSMAGIKHYAGAIPPGQDVASFLDICRICGEFYGGSLERKCIFDKSFITFLGCQEAVYSRR